MSAAWLIENSITESSESMIHKGFLNIPFLKNNNKLFNEPI